MPNNVRIKAVPITLDKERHIKFDLNALIELENRFGDVNDAFKAMESNSMKGIRTLLWAGLLHEDENLTEKQVGGLIDIVNISGIANLLTEAINDALPDQEKNSPIPTE